MPDKKMLYLLIVNYSSYNLVKQLIDRFQQNKKTPYQIIIVNNYPEEKPDLQNLTNQTVKVLEIGKNIGFGRACNVGLSWIYQVNPHSLVWLLNPDTSLESNMITQVIKFFQTYSNISILGTAIARMDQTIWFGGGFYQPLFGQIKCKPKPLNKGYKPYFNCDWVSGCSMIINLAKFSQCPKFNPNYFLYYEDFDFCQRYQNQGHFIAMTPQICITHQVSTVANRNLKKKLYHSTYSYLLTLARYTNPIVFYLRLIRLLLHALILLPVNRAIALGKMRGTWDYFKK